jgi:hypothetical protein
MRLTLSIAVLTALHSLVVRAEEIIETEHESFMGFSPTEEGRIKPLAQLLTPRTVFENKAVSVYVTQSDLVIKVNDDLVVDLCKASERTLSPLIQSGIAVVKYTNAVEVQGKKLAEKWWKPIA